MGFQDALNESYEKDKIDEWITQRLNYERPKIKEALKLWKQTGTTDKDKIIFG